MGILPASPAAAADATYSLYRSLGTPRVVVVVVVVTGTGGSDSSSLSDSCISTTNLTRIRDGAGCISRLSRG